MAEEAGDKEEQLAKSWSLPVHVVRTRNWSSVIGFPREQVEKRKKDHEKPQAVPPLWGLTGIFK